MRTRDAIDTQLALKSAKAQRLPDLHPDRATLHAEINALLTEREQVTATLRPSHVRAMTGSVRP